MRLLRVHVAQNVTTNTVIGSPRNGYHEPIYTPRDAHLAITVPLRDRHIKCRAHNRSCRCSTGTG